MQEAGLDQGIFVHEDGTICEGPNLNLGIVTREGIIVVPPFEGALAGCTMSRIMELVPHYMQLGISEDIVGIRQVRPAGIAAIAVPNRVKECRICVPWYMQRITLAMPDKIMKTFSLSGQIFIYLSG